MRVLSYGCGVNSTAILALIKLGKHPMPDRIIFCDTGAERPVTYCYLKYISKHFNIEICKYMRLIARGKNKGIKIDNLIDYCNLYKIIPARMTRWCSIEFKVKAYDNYVMNVEHTKILGISAEEKHRVKDDKAEYPLVDMNIDRKQCIEIIKKAGFDVPEKSGCFICPFMKMSELNNLRKYHPAEFDILCKLEKQANTRNKKIFFKDMGNRLIPEYCNDNQTEFIADGFENYQHCLCKYD
jgi:hypothetical protein